MTAIQLKIAKKLIERLMRLVAKYLQFQLDHQMSILLKIFSTEFVKNYRGCRHTANKTRKFWRVFCYVKITFEELPVEEMDKTIDCM